MDAANHDAYVTPLDFPFSGLPVDVDRVAAPECA
jgi:hypothetical protein